MAVEIVPWNDVLQRDDDRLIEAAGRGLHHDVRPKAPDLEPPLGVQLTEPLDGGRGQYVDNGAVEERARR